MGAFHVLDRGSSPRIGKNPFFWLGLFTSYPSPGFKSPYRNPFFWLGLFTSYPSPGFKSPYRKFPFWLGLFTSYPSPGNLRQIAGLRYFSRCQRQPRRPWRHFHSP